MTDSFSVQNFKKDTSGTMTMWNVISMIGLLSIGGLAVDTSNAWRVKAMLQNTADVSALAAAIHIEDQSAAKDMAVNFARRNMPQNVHGDVVRRGDVEFGTYDSATQIFTPTKMNPDAVRVYAGRDSARSNAVSTYLLKLTGITDLDVGRGSIAYPKWGGNETEECAGATIISTGFVVAGNDNTLVDGVCMHGQLGIETGANAYFDADVRLSSINVLNAIFGTIRTGSFDPESLFKQQSKTPSVLPSLENRFNELWEELSETETELYSGSSLPDFLLGPDGTADIVRRPEAVWTATASNVKEYSIYVVDGDVKLQPGLSGKNFAIIAKGSITGSGRKSAFKNVFFFGEGELRFAGSVTWGDKSNYCESGEYNTYLLSQTHLNLGANSANSSTHGVVGVAPSFNAGGALRDVGGVYLEIGEAITNLGGGIEITNACDEGLSAMMETTEFMSERRVVGSSLRR